MLVKEQLQSKLESSYKAVFSNRNSSTNENESPEDAIAKVANELAKATADAVDEYLKSGDIMVSASNIVVTAPNGPCVVAPASPAKMI